MNIFTFVVYKVHLLQFVKSIVLNRKKTILKSFRAKDWLKE